MITKPATSLRTIIMDSTAFLHMQTTISFTHRTGKTIYRSRDGTWLFSIRTESAADQVLTTNQTAFAFNFTPLGFTTKVANILLECGNKFWQQTCYWWQASAIVSNDYAAVCKPTGITCCVTTCTSRFDQQQMLAFILH